MKKSLGNINKGCHVKYKGLDPGTALKDRYSDLRDAFPIQNTH